MKCFMCSSSADTELYGIPVCNACKAELRLFSDNTILRQARDYRGFDAYASYHNEVFDRLQLLEVDYLKKRIKLLHILDRLEALE